jgi:hypothetical protein
MNGDLQELMTYIGEKHDEQMSAIAHLGIEFAEHKGEILTRVSAIEDGIKDEKFWTNIKILFGPVVVVLYAIARKLGVNV